MFSFLTPTWNAISRNGIGHAKTESERRELIDLNRGLAILLLIQALSFVSHIINGPERSAWITGIFIVGLMLIRLLLLKGHMNMAKMSGIVLINYNTVSMAVFLGEHTHIIDFLPLTALLPLYFFDTRNRKLIYWGISLSIVPFAIYYFAAPYIAGFAVPLAEQMAVNKTTEPVKFLSMAALLYLIYQK